MFEITEHRLDAQRGVVGADPCRGVRQRACADVQRDIGAQVGRGVQQDARLLASARSKLDQHGVRAEISGQSGRPIPQQRRLLPRRIVFRKGRDLFEQARPLGVIKPFGRYGLLVARQAIDNVAPESCGLGVVRRRGVPVRGVFG